MKPLSLSAGGKVADVGRRFSKPLSKETTVNLEHIEPVDGINRLIMLETKKAKRKMEKHRAIVMKNVCFLSFGR